MAKGKKECSDRQEKLIAAYLNWKQVKGSGSRPLHPGDIISDNWLGECKTHISLVQKIIFNFDVWDKLAEEASSQFKYPALFVDDGSQTISNTFVMIELKDVDKLNYKIVDYSDKKSFRFNSSKLFESEKFVNLFSRKDKYYCIFWLPQFLQFLRCE